MLRLFRPLHSRILTIFYLVEEVQYKLNCHKYHGDHNRANEHSIQSERSLLGIGLSLIHI